MKVNQVKLIGSAVSTQQFPPDNLPEIVLVGRSNVGKSSLINCLIERNGFAHTSSKPGKTQTLNFYEINGKMRLVDVPGYGYARVSKQERERFGAMIESYLETRQELRGAIQLVDSRHKPTDDDVTMHQYLQYYQIPLLTVLTKVDKVKSNQRAKNLKLIVNTLQSNDEAMRFFSSQTHEGRDEVWQWINQQVK